jgi:uncharacterized protein
LKTKIFLYIVCFIFISSGLLFSQSDRRSLADDPTAFRQYVIDETGTLTAEEINILNQKLRTQEKETSNQIVVYMIPSLGGESLEDISIRLAEKNLIGQEGKDNGVLLLIVKDDRELRIEVGYGLEGVLTDALSSQIIRNEITPEFKQGRYYEGITLGVDAIIRAIKGEYTADDNSDSGDGIACCFGLPVFIIFIFGFIFMMIFFSLFGRIFGFGSTYRTGGKSKSSKSGGFWGGGGSWGGSSGGGGFSGGGGSFGGGGASGSW